MIRRFLSTCVTAAVIVVAGKIVSDYAETKPELKNIKEKIKKTGNDFSADCKDVGIAIKQAVMKETAPKTEQSAEML